MDLYNLACAHSHLCGLSGQAGPGIVTTEAEAEAEKAMQMLRRTVAAG